LLTCDCGWLLPKHEVGDIRAGRRYRPAGSARWWLARSVAVGLANSNDGI